MRVIWFCAYRMVLVYISEYTQNNEALPATWLPFFKASLLTVDVGFLQILHTGPFNNLVSVPLKKRLLHKSSKYLKEKSNLRFVQSIQVT